jgi:cytochrome b
MLSGVIVLHLVAVILTELHEGGDIISAMFTGRKILDRPPRDV